LGGDKVFAGAPTRHLLHKIFEKTAIRKMQGIFAAKIEAGHNCGNNCTTEQKMTKQTSYGEINLV